MNWLTPIGFLGLCGLIVLIVIYVIKPNYQNKRISSTYVWRLSLKYRKQRLPISRIQNILTFICQALIITALGLLLATPVIETLTASDGNEAVIVIDASANMRMRDSEKTRFERAVLEARRKAEETLALGSPVTLILADDTPELLLARVGESDGEKLLSELEGLLLEADERCVYTSSDIGGAMTLAESVLESNPAAEVYLYTATDYAIDSGATVVNVSGSEEWNAGILDCRAELDNDNHYEVTVRAACYGRTDFLTVYCKIHGVNGDPDNTVTLEKGEFFDPLSEEKELVFNSDDMPSGAVYSYDYIETYVSVRDSLADDNSYFLYGGRKSVINIQYASSSPNNFFESAVRSLRENNKETFDVRFTVLRDGEEPMTEGYDIYIFEHKMPDVLPTDGVVLLVDPRSAPQGLDIEIGSSYSVDSSSTLSAGASHELTKYTLPQYITIAKYNDIIISEGYEELMFYNGRPVMLMRDTPESRVVVWAFDLNYSNLIALPDFSILIYNMFNYFISEIFEGHSFLVGDTVAINGRGDTLTVVGGGEEITLEGEGELTPTRPGTYTVIREGADGETLEESFFVGIPEGESNTRKTAEALRFTEADEVNTVEFTDLVIYFAIALFLLMLFDWVLEIKRNY